MTLICARRGYRIRQHESLRAVGKPKACGGSRGRCAHVDVVCMEHRLEGELVLILAGGLRGRLAAHVVHERKEEA